MAISVQDIQKLRARTGAGMADCKKALQEADGDMEGAIEILRKKGAATAAKRSDKAANEGVVATAVSDDHKRAAIVEVNCETDFVARNEEFVAFTENLVGAILANEPKSMETLLQLAVDGETVEAHLNELLAKFSELIEISRFDVLKTESGFVTNYVHGGSKLAVLVELTAQGSDMEKTDELARNVAMQVAAMNPVTVSRDGVPADKVEKEKEIYRDQIKDSGKPPEIIEKIVTGRVEKFFEEACLLEQSYVKDSAKSIKDVLAEFSKEAGVDITAKRFIRYNLGEGGSE